MDKEHTILNKMKIKEQQRRTQILNRVRTRKQQRRIWNAGYKAFKIFCKQWHYISDSQVKEIANKHGLTTLEVLEGLYNLYPFLVHKEGGWKQPSVFEVHYKTLKEYLEENGGFDYVYV